MSEVNQDEADLAMYEGVRRKMVIELSKDGIPKDIETGNLLLKALDGGSKIILTKKRLEVDKSAIEGAAATQQLMSEILRNSPTVKQKLGRTEALPSIDIVAPKPGEIEIGSKSVFYKDIMQQK